MNKKVVLGLDLGIASVGWCLTDISHKENKEFPIILHGVRLFETVDDGKTSKLLNGTKREKRSLRRRNRRLFTRKRDFIKYLIDNKIINLKFDKNSRLLVQNFVDTYINPFNKDIEIKYKNVTNLSIGFHNLRKAAITKDYKLTKNEIIVLLYFYLSLRGGFFDNPEETKSKVIPKSEVEFFDQELKNNNLPIDKVIRYFKKYKKIRSTINLKFSHKNYLEEIKQVFENQIIDFITYEKFAVEEKSFFSRIRDYSKGPGNEKSFSKYGVYADEKGNPKVIINENGQKIYEKIYNTLWEKTIGKCSYDNNLYRAPKNSFSAKVFDIVNKLVDWKHNDEPLPEIVRKEILLSRFKNKDSKTAIKKILEKYGMDLIHLSKIAYDDKEDKIILPKIEESYHNVIPIFKKYLHNYQNILISENNLDDLFNHYRANYKKLFLPNESGSYEINNNNNILNIFDGISYILNKFSTTEDREKNLKEYFTFLKLNSDVKSDEFYKKLSELKGFNKTSSLSFAAYYKFIPNLISESKNYSTISYEEKALQSQKNINEYSNLFSKTWIEELIASPTIKRTLRQTMNLLKEIFKYSEKNNLDIEKIVIEVTRSSNNKDEREKITGINKFREKKYKEIREKYGLENASFSLLKKLWLLEQQKNYDAYSLKYIDGKNVIKNPKGYDIEHIIPKSLSFDNSFSNLVLVNSLDNADKSNTLSVYDLIIKKYGAAKWEEAKKTWASWYINNPKERVFFNDKDKFRTLTTITDLKDFDNNSFINRNLSDTGYITNALVNHLSFTNSKYQYSVVSVNGKQTSSLRRQIAFVCVKKNGEVWKRPEGFNDLELKNFISKEENKNDIKNDVIFKDRSFNGHHAEDAYFLTIISQYFRNFKKIEKWNVNFRKNAKELDEFEKNDIKFKEKSDFDDLFLSNILAELNNSLNQIRFSRMVNARRNSVLFKEKIYAGKYNKEKEILKVIKKLDLLSNKDGDIKHIKTFFEEEKIIDSKLDNLHIFKHDKKLYDELKIIWNDMKQEIIDKKLKFKNYFNYFISQNFENKKITFDNGIPIFNTNDSLIRKIRYIKYFYIKDSKITNLIFAQNNNLDIVKRKNFSFFNYYEWLQIWVFKNKKDEFCFIPIDVRNAKVENNKIEINQDKLKNQFEKLNILNKTPIFKLNKGDLFLNENKEIVFLVGRKEKSQELEFKYILGKKINQRKRMFKIIKDLPNYEKINLNYMGEKFKA